MSRLFLACRSPRGGWLAVAFCLMPRTTIHAAQEGEDRPGREAAAAAVRRQEPEGRGVGRRAAAGEPGRVRASTRRAGASSPRRSGTRRACPTPAAHALARRRPRLPHRRRPRRDVQEAQVRAASRRTASSCGWCGTSTATARPTRSSVFADGFNRPRTASPPACSPARATSTSPASPTCAC